MEDAGNPIRVLCLSDQVVPLVDSPQVADTFSEVDLLVGCGDLPAAYLEYALTMLRVPLIYVHGNHDSDDYQVPGGDNIEGKYRVVQGLRFLGFGGSPRYKAKGRHQYTELEMTMRMIAFLPRLIVQRLLSGYGVDALVTHSPPRGIHDADDIAHRGFLIFRRLIHLIRPRYMLHGHSHVHANIETTETYLAGCRIFNVYPYKLLTLSHKLGRKR
jgi:hypothetical protein